MFRHALLALAAVAIASSQTRAPEPGFTSIFDGKTLSGWRLVGGHGPGYVVENGMIVCPKEGGGNLFTEKEYANFVLRFEFKLEAGSNNGIGIRAPYEGDSAYQGMEIQVLDDQDKRYAGWLKPTQVHGSIYDVVRRNNAARSRPASGTRKRSSLTAATFASR